MIIFSIIIRKTYLYLSMVKLGSCCSLLKSPKSQCTNQPPTPKLSKSWWNFISKVLLLGACKLSWLVGIDIWNWNYLQSVSNALWEIALGVGGHQLERPLQALKLIIIAYWWKITPSQAHRVQLACSRQWEVGRTHEWAFQQIFYYLEKPCFVNISAELQQIFIQ